MLSIHRCYTNKTLFTFVRVELISFLPFTDCSNCRAGRSRAACLRWSAVRSIGGVIKPSNLVQNALQNSLSILFDGVLWPHVWPHKPTTFTFMCVTGTYVDVNPLWRDACFDIYLCLCGCNLALSVCVCVCSHVSLVCNLLCSLCACVCVPMRGLVGRRRHNEMGGWAGASHH